MKKILFVCLGNICRSPLAECIMRNLVEQRFDDQIFVIDSAGTSGYHQGEESDPRARKVARENGLSITHRARQIQPQDFDKFDLIIAMDGSVKQKIEEMGINWGKTHHHIELMRKYDDQQSCQDVADPYYGSDEDFRNCYQIILESCKNLEKHLN